MRISHQQVIGLGGVGGLSVVTTCLLSCSGPWVLSLSMQKKFKIKFSSFDSDMIMQENPSNSLKVLPKIRKGKGATSCLSRVWNTGRQ